MLIHYLKTTWHQFRRSPLFSFINLFGLATSMAICLMIFLFVYQELSYDRFHHKAEDIYRLSIHLKMQGEERTEPLTSPPMGPDLLENLPEVINMVRMIPLHPVKVWQDDRYVTIEKGLLADSTFFEVFNFNLLQGDPATALAAPYSLVLTQSLSQKLFKEDDPLGKTLRLNDEAKLYVVTGVVADCPPNSHIDFELIRPYSQQYVWSNANFSSWDANMGSYTYVVLAPNTNLDDLLNKTRELSYEKVNHKFEGMGVSINISYFPITDIRLHSHLNFEMKETGTHQKVWLFAVVALFVLFIAGFNYVNLTIAQSGKRAREVGIRTVLGAHKRKLNSQFLLETFFITGISFLVALVLAEISLPLFNQMMDTSLMLFNLPWWVFLLTVLIFIVVFGFLASLYPAWYMTSLQPVKILKGEFWKKPGRFQPRNLLLLLQFAVSLALIVCTLVIFLQIRFFHTSDYGFQSKGLIAIRTNNLEDSKAFSQSLKKFPWVTSQSISSSFPAGESYMEGITPQDVEPGIMAHRHWVDQDYFSTLGIRLDKGRFFSRDDGLEAENVIVNKALVQQTGWNQPLGKTIFRDNRTFRIVGVVDDFHFQSLHHQVEPLMINVLTSRSNYQNRPWWVIIRYDEMAGTEVLIKLQKQWDQLFPQRTFSFHFVSDLMNQQYATERSFGRLFISFTLVAILIALLGILGLSAFAAQQKQKEIGIRRVLGASSFSVLTRMALTFLIWILLAAVIAFPLAYQVMTRWLSGFAYAIDFPWWTMGAALISMMIIALSIIIFQTITVARSNPTETLKAE